jgi:hypothetical protein
MKTGYSRGLFEIPSLLPATAIRGTSFPHVGSLRSRSRLRWNMAPSRKSSKRSAPVVCSLTMLNGRCRIASRSNLITTVLSPRRDLRSGCATNQFAHFLQEFVGMDGLREKFEVKAAIAGVLQHVRSGGLT